MKELPKLNKVAVDDEPEPKTKRDILTPCLFILVALFGRFVLNCCGISVPIISSWKSWCVAVIVICVIADIILRIGKKWYSEKINKKLEEYVVPVCLSIMTFLTL
ncbi:MAG: hypothetical protein LBC20_06535 [Planctomycetaceae bacterium]|jgi:hypothetical protein|nr:hypothetical protein [Planctomycetaceae bacterium]